MDETNVGRGCVGEGEAVVETGSSMAELDVDIDWVLATVVELAVAIASTAEVVRGVV